MSHCEVCGQPLPASPPQMKIGVRVSQWSNGLYIYPYDKQSEAWVAEQAPKFGTFYPDQFPASFLSVSMNYDITEVKAYLESYRTPQAVEVAP